MALEDLIGSVEVSAQERLHEIQERSKAEADEIIREAQSRGGSIRKRHHDKAVAEVELQRNRLLSSIRKENQREILKMKNEIFQAALDEAERRLAAIREQPGYRTGFNRMLGEVVSELGEKDVILHIDPRDSLLCRELLLERSLNYDVIPDLVSAGGLSANTRDERFTIVNTIESRLKKAGEVYRPDIVAILFGD
ncbi:MAG: V-type ATP synthase subunit E [Methanoregulaceae archaeon]|nr:V-type ATP synthase subunit E [Methanoregulaceae archaeon]